MSKKIIYLLASMTLFLVVGCGVQLQAIDTSVDGAGAAEDVSGPATSDVVFRFFDDDFMPGGYSYVYPDESRVWVPEESGKVGEVAVQMDLIANDWSGGAICLWNMQYDLTPYLETGALQFWIKGKNGGEVFWIQLLDAEGSHGESTAIRVPSSDYGTVTTDWTLFTVPLRDFGHRGAYWDSRKRIEVSETFEWDKVTGFRVTIDQNANPEFTVWIDYIVIARDAVDPQTEEQASTPKHWDERVEVLPAPGSKPAVTVVKEINKGELPGGGFAYEYGGKTGYAVQSTEEHNPVFASYLDPNDFSGVTLALGEGNNIDLTAARDNPNSAIAFWGKAGPGVNSVFFSIGDDESNGNKAMTRLNLNEYGISEEWNYYVIPLEDFRDRGLYWCDINSVEIAQNIEWHNINEFRFSINMGENPVEEGEPATFYMMDLEMVEVE